MAQYTSRSRVQSSVKCQKQPLIYTAIDVRDAMSSCTREKSPGMDDPAFELYLHLPDLFGGIFADICHNRQENDERISTAVSFDVVVLLTNDNFSTITLLNADCKILA